MFFVTLFVYLGGTAYINHILGTAFNFLFIYSFLQIYGSGRNLDIQEFARVIINNLSPWHCTLFPDRYLEELSDVIQTTEIEIQTDAFKDRPPSPLFIPAKSGKDAETQIEEGEVSKSLST